MINAPLIDARETIESRLSKKEWDKFFNIMNGYVYTQTMAAACEFGLFDYLQENPGASAAEICKALDFRKIDARVFLLACCSTELIERDPITFGYHNSKISEAVLTTSNPKNMVPLVKYTHDVKEKCGIYLQESLKEGHNVGMEKLFPGEGTTIYERFTNYPDVEKSLAGAVSIYSELSWASADVTELGQITEILDVAGGNGTNAIRMCRQFPNLKVTVLDFPSVIEIARKNIEEHGLSDRITCVGKDMFNEEWPTGKEAVLLSHLVEIFPIESVEKLYAKAHAALRDSGRMFVWTTTANELETGGYEAAKLSLYFFTASSGEGMTYTVEDHRRTVKSIGFKEFRTYAADFDHTLVVAEK